MTTVHKFEFKKSVKETVEVGDHKFEIDFSDDNLRRLHVGFHDFYKKYEEKAAVQAEKLNGADAEKYMDEVKTLIKDFIDFVLGANAFDKVYELSGASLLNMVDFIGFLGELIKNKLDNKPAKRDQYVKQGNRHVQANGKPRKRR